MVRSEVIRKRSGETPFGRSLAVHRKVPTIISHPATMKTSRIAFSTLLLLATAPLSQATIVGFGNLGGSNTTIPSTLASNASAAGNGFVISNGATPNISLTWDTLWDIHTSPFFTELENQTVGGGDWDNEGGGPRIGQFDSNTHTIDFIAGSGYGLVLNSFDMANTPEGVDLSIWSIVLTNSGGGTVWSTVVNLQNNDTDVVTVTPTFTGLDGQSYKLTFTQTGTATAVGHIGIDNLSFNEVAVPEPSLTMLAGIGGLALGLRRRK